MDQLPWPFVNISTDRLSAGDFLLIGVLVGLIALQDIFGDNIHVYSRKLYWFFNACIVVLFVFFIWVVWGQIQQVT